MRGFCLMMVAALWPIIGATAPLRVQTGEHPDFTRVVIAIPQGAEWQLGRTAEGYALRIAGAEGFVLDQFFDLIPKDRIAAVTQDTGRGEMRLRVDCPCYARASVYRAEFLVIDISDGPVPPNARFEQALPPRDQSASDAPSVELRLQTYRPEPSRLLPLITPRFGMPQPEEVTRNDTAEDAVDSDPASQVAEKAPADQALRLIAQSLSEGLGRGLTEGLLEEGLRIKGDAAPAAKRIGPMPDIVDDALPGVDARTSIDPRVVASAAAGPQTQVGQTCFSETMFDVASWGSERSPPEQLADARNALIDPADQFEDGALLALARLYVFLGFGREAQQALDLEGVQSRERVMLRALAQIIDDEPVVQSLFAGQVSCPTNVALWALLAQTSAPTDAWVDRTAVINAYRALPVFVQQAVAPRLAEALLAIGAQDEAMQVLGQRPTVEQQGIDRVLAEAALAGALGEEDQAIEKIGEAVRSGPRASPEAMSRFFLDGAEREIAFSDADFVLADALRFENAETQAAVGLAEAQFGAYLSVNRFENARTLLASLRAAISSQEMAASRAALFGQAAERMPDAAFLEFIWQEDLQDLNAVTQIRVGERLLDLGFPDRALSVLSAASEGVMAERQNTLRSQARQISTALQPSTEVSESVRGQQRQAASGTADAAFLSAVDGPTLRRSRALVDDAVQSRESIRALLQGVPAPANF